MAQQAEASALPSRIPLFIEPENRAETVEQDSRLVNCYIERRRNLEGQTEYWINKRPGMDEYTRPPAADATGRGVFNWRGTIYSIFGNRFYVGTTATGAAVNATNGVYRFSSVLGATPRLVMGDGVEGYYYDSGGGLANIADVDFPSAFLKGWSYLNGTLYVGTADPSIQGSDINDPAAWDPLNIIIPQIEPDMGVALAKQLVYVIAIKQWSTEVFYDAQNAAGTPLGRVEGAKAEFGAASGDSVQDVDGMLFWIATSRSANVQVAKFSQLKLEMVSTPAIERLLQDADFTTVYSWQVCLSGHRFYVVTIVNENLTLAYDIDENLWSQWTDASGNYVPIVSSTFDVNRRAILQHESNGRLYYCSPSYLDDDGAVIDVNIYTPNWDAGVASRGKACNMLTVLADQVAGSELEVRVNDRDFNVEGWSQPRSFDLSRRLPSLSGWGTFNRRSHHFRHRKPTRFRMRAVEVQMDLCTGPAP